MFEAAFCRLRPVPGSKSKDPSSTLHVTDTSIFRPIHDKKRTKEPTSKKFLNHIAISKHIFFYICNGLFRRKPYGWKGESRLYWEDVYKRLSFVFQNFAIFDPPERWTAIKTSSWCVFIYIRASLWKTKRGCGCCTYRRGLSALFVLGDMALRRPWNTERTKVRFPRLFCIFSITEHANPSVCGNQGHSIQESSHGSCRTADRTKTSRTRAHSHLVRYSIMLYPAQRLQDFQKREYRHSSAMAYILHPQPWLFPRLIQRHQQ